jgi:hypothetical protein
VVLTFAGCATTPPPPFTETAERTRVQDDALRAALFPVNLAPNIASNFVVGLVPGNLWPIQYMVLPVGALYWGIGDALYGYPFWCPTVLHD